MVSHILRGGGDADVTFGPNYRFTSGERDRGRLDLGFRLRAASLGASAPPAAVVRAVRRPRGPFGGGRDTLYFLDGRGRVIVSTSNGHGDDWVRHVIPQWR